MAAAHPVRIYMVNILQAPARVVQVLEKDGIDDFSNLINICNDQIQDNIIKNCHKCDEEQTATVGVVAPAAGQGRG